MGFTITYQRNNHEQFKRNAKDAIYRYSGDLDIDKAIHKIRVREIISSERCNQLLARCSQCREIREKLCVMIFVLLDTERLEKVFKVLDVAGLSTIADEICRPLDRTVGRTDLPHSKHLQKFYFQLKQCIDNGCFKNRGRYLSNLSTRIKALFQTPSNENDLSKASGRFAVVTWLRIQHCNRETQLIRSVLHDMCESWPFGVDKTLCHIFFQSKMAIADIMDGEVGPALKKNRKAKYLCVPYHDTLTKALLSHDSRYVHQRVYELNRSEESRSSILNESKNGLDYLSSDDNGCDLFNRLMKRMFLLYVVQHRLMIQNDLNTEHSNGISENDLKHAKTALLWFDETMRPDNAISNGWEEKYLEYRKEKLANVADRENNKKSEDTTQTKCEFNSPENLTKETCREDDTMRETFVQTFTRTEILDPRRGMIYMVCRAKYCEKTKKINMAKFLLKKANDLTDDGRIYQNEFENIKNFISRLSPRSCEFKL